MPCRKQATEIRVAIRRACQEDGTMPLVDQFSANDRAHARFTGQLEKPPCRDVLEELSISHAKRATVTRTVDQRGQTVYIDYLQNLRGKTLRPCTARGRASSRAFQRLLSGATLSKALDLRTLRFGSAM